MSIHDNIHSYGVVDCREERQVRDLRDDVVQSHVAVHPRGHDIRQHDVWDREHPAVDGAQARHANHHECQRVGEDRDPGAESFIQVCVREDKTYR